MRGIAMIGSLNPLAMDPHDEIFSRLQTWQPELEPDPELNRRVSRRLAIRRATETTWPIQLGIWAGALGCLAVAAMLFWGQQLHRSELAAQQEAYFARLELAAPPVEDGLEAQASMVDLLDWMRQTFALDEAQFVALVEIHRQHDARLEDLRARLMALRVEYRRFEDQRLRAEEIDFLALYGLLQQREHVRGAVSAETDALVDDILRVLHPDQQTLFLNLWRTAHSTPPADAQSPWTPQPPATPSA